MSTLFLNIAANIDMNHIHQVAQQSLLLLLAFWLYNYASLYFVEDPDSSKENQGLRCFENKINNTEICRPQCQHGYFSLPGMTECNKWLTCSDFDKELQILEPMAHGAVKTINKAKIRGHIVAYSKLRFKEYAEDFQYGLMMLKKLQPSRYVTQLVGFCGDAFITEYHPFGTALNVNSILRDIQDIGAHDDINTRFQICINYVNVIHFLHNSPIGTRVMCDSNDLEKTLSQFLLNPDLTLVVNDLDALPEVINGRGIKCGHRELFGDFVAPEQLWPHLDKPFQDDLMPTYDEKTDVWKIPNVCNHFLGNSNDASFLQFHLYQIHKQCKDPNPANRPTTEQILKVDHDIKLTLGM